MTPYIDLHCDTLTCALSQNKKTIYRLDNAMADVERLKKAHVMAQFFAVFFPPAPGENGQDDDILFFLQAREILMETLRRHPADIAFAGNGEELARNDSQRKVSAFLTLEDGRAVDGKAEMLQWFYERGVRLITLTWNHPNCFGFPNSKDPGEMGKGLTEFGVLAVKEMNRLGILIDVSHLSDGGFWDVVRYSEKPFVASHSNCRALTPHPRNLTDEMLRALADHGGVAGVNLAPVFLRNQPGDQTSRVERIAEHVIHMIRNGGEELPAIGSDFDGTQGELEIDEPGKMKLLFAELKKRGLTERQIEKIAFQNAARLIESNNSY